MPYLQDRWLDHVLARNEAFREGIDPDKLPVGRAPGRFALVTCMDPRINLHALGIAPFGADGSGASGVRIMRTIGGMAEDRSLIVAIHLAGIREIAFVAHTDCGNSLAKAKIETMIENLRASLDKEAYRSFVAQIGEPFPESLIAYLKAFDDPHRAVRREIETVRQKPFVPNDVMLHGLVYDLATGRLEVVVNGYG